MNELEIILSRAKRTIRDWHFELEIDFGAGGYNYTESEQEFITFVNCCIFFFINVND